MRIVILESAESVSQRAADLFCDQLKRNPNSVLGLATGGTPVATYRELLRRYDQNQVSFEHATTFNLDEYVGLEPAHEQSYRSFMNRELFESVDIDLAQTHFPATLGDLTEAGQRYEASLVEAGGIDLQLLGIGTDGHIAFNEPGSSLASRTRPKALTQRTRMDNARFFDSLESVPKLSMTMGIGTILDAKQILLIATGQNKSKVCRKFIEGPVTALVPASALQMHPRVTVLLDEEAAQDLERADYYREVEAIQSSLENQNT